MSSSKRRGSTYLKDKSDNYEFVSYDNIQDVIKPLPSVIKVINKHINNAVYILWACEAVESEFRLKHNPAKISINFKKEGFIGEKIMVITEQNDKKSLHSVRTYGDSERELARVAIEWK